VFQRSASSFVLVRVVVVVVVVVAVCRRVYGV